MAGKGLLPVGWPAQGIAGAMLGAHQLAMQKWAHMAGAPIPVGVSMSGKHSHSQAIVGWAEVRGLARALYWHTRSVGCRLGDVAGCLPDALALLALLALLASVPQGLAH